MPYSFTPMLRFTPPAGAPVTVDLTSLDRIVAADVIWTPLFEAIEMVDRSMETERYGWRLGVHLELFCTPASATDATLRDSVWHWLNRADTDVEVSMDGSVYRVCHLTGWKRTKQKKRNIGVIYAIDLACQEVISESALPPESRTAPSAMEGWA